MSCSRPSSALYLPLSLLSHSLCPSAIICLARMRLLVLAHNKIIYCIINNTRRSRNHSPTPPPPSAATAMLLFNFDLHFVPSIKTSQRGTPRPSPLGNKINKIKIKIYKSVAAMLQQCVRHRRGRRTGGG